MSGKKLLTGVLLAVVIAGVVVLLYKEFGSSQDAGREAAASAGGSAAVADPGSPGQTGKSPQSGHRLVAYYFHGRVRCVSCVKIEALSGKAIRERFPEDLRTGVLAFREVNVDLPENRHFIDDYHLTSQSLVLVEYRDGRQVRWKNLEKVWVLLDSEKEFLPYVQEGISSWMRDA